MPAVLVGRQRSNAGADDTGEDYKGGVWRAGEIVSSFEETHRFGFQEMPILPFGARSVEQVNGLDVTSVPIYSAVQMTDSGVVTSGTGDDVGVFTGDVIVLQQDDSWTNFGLRTEVPNGFFHIKVTDKTQEEVELYLESWTKVLTYETDQYDPSTDRRRWTSTNIRVSATGQNGFTEQGILDAIAEWNTQYPDNDIFLVDTDNLEYFQVETTDGNDGMPADLFDEWKATTQRLAISDLYKRRRWYITQAGLDALSANDWTLQGTAADINPFLRDGLLD